MEIPTLVSFDYWMIEFPMACILWGMVIGNVYYIIKAIKG